MRIRALRLMRRNMKNKCPHGHECGICGKPKRYKKSTLLKERLKGG